MTWARCQYSWRVLLGVTPEPPGRNGPTQSPRPGTAPLAPAPDSEGGRSGRLVPGSRESERLAHGGARRRWGREGSPGCRGNAASSGEARRRDAESACLPALAPARPRPRPQAGRGSRSPAPGGGAPAPGPRPTGGRRRSRLRRGDARQKAAGRRRGRARPGPRLARGQLGGRGAGGPLGPGPAPPPALLPPR